MFGLLRIPCPVGMAPAQGSVEVQACDPENELDNALVARIGAGDRSAFVLLVDRHAARLETVARRMLGCRHAAEDVVQEVFMKVWIAAPGWRPEGAFAGWLYRVCINLCLDRLRRPNLQTLDMALEVPDLAPDPEQSAASRQFVKLVRDAIEDLPGRQRTAIALCGEGGLSNSQAALVLEISPKALESLLVRARRSLRRRMSHHLVRF